ncbi:hypothetical protein CK203_067713 [Vitis vinifera]|uniref:Bromo-adjacent domain-containing protein n=1 Tax=Vitis vinifera TaxID=29760 RepID=A0A438BZG0_VITVI|nr:hypothetical protein CK203_067713 [Vitis vinifera]
MQLDMELDFEKYCSLGLSPRTVLPSNQRYLGIGKRNTKEKPARRSNLLSIEEDFAEISFGDFHSFSCKSIPYRPVGVEGNVELKRGSIYQSSEEVRKKKKMDEEDPVLEEKRSPVKSLNSDLNASSVRKPCSQVFSLPSSPGHFLTRGGSSDGFSEIGLNLDNRENHSAESAERDSIRDSKFKCDDVVGPQNDSNDLLERETVLTLYKSLSAKVALPHSPSRSESDYSRTSPKARFNPIRKMFDPFTKSKSQRSPLHSVVKPGGVTKGPASGRNNKTFRKSLLHDFANTTQHVELASQFAKKEFHHYAVPCSPAHLHGHLKLETKHGVPFFEFSLKHPEDVLVAKTWKVNNAFNWVYTFHSIRNRKKSNASGWGLKDSNKETSMVDRCKCPVTCVQNYKMAAEPAKGSNEGLAGQSLELDDVSDDAVKLKCQTNHASNHDDFDAAVPYPWAPANLHPDLEIAAIVIQKKKDVLDMSPAKVKVVTASGNHGLPSGDSRGPSSLLDRWRLGGGCDCGGWDMACPLIVFDNPSILSVEDCPLMENPQPLELFVQGAKERVPALTITRVEEGQYAVDFHAQLSTLQAFSICVAMLHSSEAFSTTGDEKNRHLLHCNSLKMLIEEEVKFLIEAVTEEEKRKVPKLVEGTLPPFVFNPPFSPIARV